MEPCSDVVTIDTGDASFAVRITAVMPKVKLEMPQQLDFGFASVNEVRTAQLLAHQQS